MSNRATDERFQESVSCGFYDSLGGDRKYSTSQMASLVSGLISDGVFSTIGNCFTPSASTDIENTIYIDTGKCWFNDTWLENTAILPLKLPPADDIGYRMDAVVIEINKNVAVRDSSIWYISGDVSYDEDNIPYPKSVRDDDSGFYQYPICYVVRTPGSSYISPANVTPVIGDDEGSETPYVHHVVTDTRCPIPTKTWAQNINKFVADEKNLFESKLSDLINEFDNWYAEQVGTMETRDAEFAEWGELQKQYFSAWFDTIKDILDDEVAGSLKLEIDENEIKALITNGLPDGAKTFSDDGRIITSTNLEYKLVKTFSSDFSTCSSVLSKKFTADDGNESYAEIANLEKQFNSDGSIYSELTII